MSAKYNIAIIPCAGVGKRFGNRDKLYRKLGTLPILIYTLNAFLRCKDIHDIILVVHPDLKTMETTDRLIERYVASRKIGKARICLPYGGKTRQESVWNGLQEAETFGRNYKIDIVAVHDGARPFVTPEMISLSIREAKKHGACIYAVPSKDTLKEEQNGYVSKTLPREKIVSVQTPQTFRYDILYDAFVEARKDNFTGTDESSLVERLGIKVKILQGSYRNIKITTQEDMLIAGAFMKSGGREQ